MIEYSNDGRLVESISELPTFDNLSTIELLFADFETTSNDDKLDSLNPWHHCWTAGISIAVNNVPGAWYVPVQHRFGINLPKNIVADWWFSIISRTKRWANANVKYDAHVSALDLGIVPDCELYDITTHAKILDSDRMFKGGYGIDVLSRDWIGEDISRYERELKIALGKSQDYGNTRTTKMAPYATQDAITARRVYHYIEQRRPTDCNLVAQMELELTPILYNMEREGLCVDETELQLEELEVMARMLEIEVALLKRLGRSVNPSSRNDTLDVLINQFGLPAVEWTDEDDEGEPAGNISFNKKAFDKYLVHPLVDTLKIGDIIAYFKEYRQLATFKSLFVVKYQELFTTDENGISRLHAIYNQLIRTGRMSSKDPNAQQLNTRAKKLIHPAPGCAFLTYDQSQIEFRVIVHYINDPKCIRAYNNNPDTDFHEWVAGLAKIKRKPAKTLNFQNGYGGGKKKCVKSLEANMEIVGGVVGAVDQMIAEGKITEAQRAETQTNLCRRLAEKVYDDYHFTLPTLKPTSRRAAMVCRERGYVFTLHGRRRHLPATHAHNAFNSACQGEAADIQKERTIAAAAAIRGTPITMVANVHDATLFHGPIGVMRDRRVRDALAWILENNSIPLRVPLRVSCGYSKYNWAIADEGARLHVYDKNSVNQDDPLWFLRERDRYGIPAKLLEGESTFGKVLQNVER